VLKIRGVLEEHYQPATANRMLSALRGVLRECGHAELMTTEEYQLPGESKDGLTIVRRS